MQIDKFIATKVQSHDHHIKLVHLKKSWMHEDVAFKFDATMVSDPPELNQLYQMMLKISKSSMTRTCVERTMQVVEYLRKHKLSNIQSIQLEETMKSIVCITSEEVAPSTEATCIPNDIVEEPTSSEPASEPIPCSASPRLEQPVEVYKPTTKCWHYWGRGHCQYGRNCTFLHDQPVHKKYVPKQSSITDDIISLLRAELNANLKIHVAKKMRFANAEDFLMAEEEKNKCIAIHLILHKTSIKLMIDTGVNLGYDLLHVLNVIKIDCVDREEYLIAHKIKMMMEK